jgi:hypothetical protein
VIPPGQAGIFKEAIMAEHQATVTLTSLICNQGHVYARLSAALVDCPYCLQRRLDDTTEWWRNAQSANTQRDRQISALKGAITRMKKKR